MWTPFLLLLIPFFVGRALQADDQTRVNDVEENPVLPNEDFLLYLAKPATLLLAQSPALQANWTDFGDRLTAAGHRVTWSTDGGSVQLEENGVWKYDTIVLIGDVLPRTTALEGGLTGRKVLDFFDSNWRLPDSHASHRQAGLNLPPSILVFNDPCNSLSSNCSRKCNSDKTTRLVAEQLGIGISDDQTATLSKLCGPKIDTELSELNFEGSSHLLDETAGLTHSHLKLERDPLIEFREHFNSSAITFVYGKRNWSRASWTSSVSLCDNNNLNNKDNQAVCDDVVNWVTHRSGVVTWSNWQHYKIGGLHAWNEYDGGEARSEWTAKELDQTLDLSRPYLYRIRDEILVALDLWTVQLDKNANKFVWMPYRRPTIQMEYVMMVPWIRKLLVPFSSSVAQPTPLMNAIVREYPNLKNLPLKLSEQTHWIHFKAPKQHGIFKLVLKGMESMRVTFPETPIWIETVMPLRTYKHDEDPRFVAAGYPFYISLISSTIMFWIVCVVFLYLPASSSSPKKID